MAINLEGKAVRKLQLPVSIFNSPIRVVSANEGDTERMLQVQLYDSSGVINIEDGGYKTAVLSASNAEVDYNVIYTITEDTSVSNNGRSIADYYGYLEKNYLYLDVPSDILIEGRMVCWLTLYDDYVEPVKILSTRKFYIDVKGQYAAESLSDLVSSFNELQNDFTKLEEEVKASVAYNLHIVDKDGHEEAISVGHLDFTSVNLLK